MLRSSPSRPTTSTPWSPSAAGTAAKSVADCRDAEGEMVASLVQPLGGVPMPPRVQPTRLDRPGTTLPTVTGVDEPIETFIARARDFYAELPERLIGIDNRLQRARKYRSLLADAGFVGISYPAEVGGQGLEPAYDAAFRDATRDLVPPEESVFGIGVGMALPTILDHASIELQRRFIPPGLRGEEIWCQLYSEPGAGSDLAGLTAKAVRDGDEWILTGQKVWTSGAQYSDLAVLLARTDADLPKHSGITMFVLPMDQAGVSVRPLVQMTGMSEFNEVFLDEARIPAEWVVGDVNGGWALAVALLGHERASLGSGKKSIDQSKSGRFPLPFDGLVKRARGHGMLDDAVIRQELAAVYIGERIIPWMTQRGLHPSIGKMWRTLQGRRAAQLAHTIGGPLATAWGSRDSDADYWAYHVLNCRGMSLGGGTDEIQKNTLGERVLRLPREPGPDRNTPFSDLAQN